MEFVFSSSRVWISDELWRVVEDYEEWTSFGVVVTRLVCQSQSIKSKVIRLTLPAPGS